MSLFIDVIEPLSAEIKSAFVQIIDMRRKNEDRSIRKVCDSCSKYLDYGELRYDKMETGIDEIEKSGNLNEPFYTLLLAVLNESLDEDATAVEHLKVFKDSSSQPLKQQLEDFIIIGRMITLKEYLLLEEAGTIMIHRYTTPETITETLSNLYLRIDDESYNQVFQVLMEKARERFPESLSLESLTGYIHIKAGDYQKALDSFLVIRDRIQNDQENIYYQFHMASTYDNIAGCYLKLGETDKTIENCDIALDHESQSEELKVGNPLLYKKAEAFLLLGKKDDARILANQVLAENPEDEKALEILSCC